MVIRSWKKRAYTAGLLLLTVPFAAASGTSKILPVCEAMASPTCKVLAPQAGTVVSGRSIIEVSDIVDREHRFMLCQPTGEQCLDIDPEPPGEYPTSTEEIFRGRVVPVKAMAWDTRRVPPGEYLLRVSCGEESTIVLILVNREPVPDFCLEVSGERTFRLSASSASDPDGPAESLRYSWFVDGAAVSQEQNFEISFDAGAGPVPVALMVEDQLGASALSPPIMLRPDLARTYFDDPETGERREIVSQGCLDGDSFIFEIDDGPAGNGGGDENGDAEDDEDDGNGLAAEEQKECLCQKMVLVTEGESEVKKEYREALHSFSVRLKASTLAGIGGVIGATAANLIKTAERMADEVDPMLGDKSGGLPRDKPRHLACGYAFEVRTEITGAAELCEESQGVQSTTISSLDAEPLVSTVEKPGPGGTADDFPLKRPEVGTKIHAFPYHLKRYGWDDYDMPTEGGKYYWPDEIRWYDMPSSFLSPFNQGGPQPPSTYLIARKIGFVACVRGTDQHRCCCTWNMTCNAAASFDQKTAELTIITASTSIEDVSCTPPR